LSVVLILGTVSPVEIAPVPNALDPNLMTAAERLDEIAAILAAGISRLRARRAARPPGDPRDLCLAIPARQSRHARNRRRREKP
jgi:hypothetical protein